ncbi:MAG: hypothetical protein U1B80_08975, partial [Anaerolineaceae bacterium]|nr:hypothetical protein [Anaerolineaceae bacterium]
MEIERREQTPISQEAIKDNSLELKRYVQRARNTVVRSVIAASLAISACSPRELADAEKPLNPNITPTTEIAPIITPTPEPTATPTPVPIATAERPPDLILGAGGAYTQTQIAVIESSPEVKKQEETLGRWLNFWGRAENAPFHPESSQLFFKYIPNPRDTNEFGVGLEAHGEHQGKIFSIPIKDGAPMENPPETSGNEKYDILTGFGPLEISQGEYTLAYINGSWARVNEQGKIAQKINQEGEWEDYLDIEVFNFYKKSEKEINPEDFSIITLDDITSGRWGRRLKEEIKIIELEENNIDINTKYFKFSDSFDTVVLRNGIEHFY